LLLNRTTPSSIQFISEYFDSSNYQASIDLLRRIFFFSFWVRKMDAVQGRVKFFAERERNRERERDFFGRKLEKESCRLFLNKLLKKKINKTKKYNINLDFSCQTGSGLTRFRAWTVILITNIESPGYCCFVFFSKYNS